MSLSCRIVTFVMENVDGEKVIWIAERKHEASKEVNLSLFETINDSSGLDNDSEYKKKKMKYIHDILIRFSGRDS